MKKLELSSLKWYNAAKIIAELSKLDDALTERTSITLCGSASVLLQDVVFRETMDIDFCTLPEPTVVKLVETLWKGKHLFDFNAVGIIGLLDDYEDRLVEVPLGFKRLRVLCLSKRDWIVSKLASPKLDDVFSRVDVTLDDLLWVKENMCKYCGISDIRANRELQMLIQDLEQRG